jgi:hypothetical protein
MLCAVICLLQVPALPEPRATRSSTGTTFQTCHPDLNNSAAGPSVQQSQVKLLQSSVNMFTQLQCVYCAFNTDFNMFTQLQCVYCAFNTDFNMFTQPQCVYCAFNTDFTSQRNCVVGFESEGRSFGSQLGLDFSVYVIHSHTRPWGRLSL